MRVLLACLLMLIATPALAGPTGRHFGVVEGWADGDTVRVRVPSWRRTPWERAKLRLVGIDTPETNRSRIACTDPAAVARVVARGQAAKAAAEAMAPAGSRVVIFVSGRVDKYGRPLAKVSRESRDIGGALLAGGHAVPYGGGLRASRCE